MKNIKISMIFERTCVLIYLKKNCSFKIIKIIIFFLFCFLDKFIPELSAIFLDFLTLKKIFTQFFLEAKF